MLSALPRRFNLFDQEDLTTKYLTAMQSAPARPAHRHSTLPLIYVAIRVVLQAAQLGSTSIGYRLSAAA
jgi:hypothetical protein